MGTVISWTSLAMWVMMALCSEGWVCSNFLTTTTDSATTASSFLDSSDTKPFKQVSETPKMEKSGQQKIVNKEKDRYSMIFDD